MNQDFAIAGSRWLQASDFSLQVRITKSTNNRKAIRSLKPVA